MTAITGVFLQFHSCSSSVRDKAGRAQLSWCNSASRLVASLTPKCPLAASWRMSEYRRNWMREKGATEREREWEKSDKKGLKSEMKDGKKWRGVGRGWLVRKRQWVGETETKTLWGWEGCWICDGRDSESFFCTTCPPTLTLVLWVNDMWFDRHFFQSLE